jgi:hypothetical protein
VYSSPSSARSSFWFVEKDLFKLAGSNSRVNADYLDAAHRLVRKVKSGELPGLED